MEDNARNITIFEAAAKGDLVAVKRLISTKKVDCNTHMVSGETALMKACANGHLHVITYLIEKKATVNKLDKWGFSALLWAVDKPNVNSDTIRYLVEHGADINVKDKLKGFSPLHKTAQYGNLEMTKYLVRKGARVLEKNAKGEMPIHLAAANNHMNLIEYFLLEQKVHLDIFQAAEEGHTNIVRYFIENQKTAVNSTDQYGWAVLHRAACGGCLVVDSKGPNLKAPATPLAATAENSHLEVISYLLKKGADVNAVDVNKRTALHIASEHGRIQVVKLLLDRGADPTALDGKGRTPVYVAVDSGFLDIVKYFLDVEKADIYQKDAEGNSLLHAAEWQGHLDIVKYLIEKKSMSVNIEDNEGNTPLAESIQRNKMAIFKYLLEEKSADFRIADKWGKTCLHKATIRGYLDIVKKLVNRGADINAKQSDGRTPVYYAAEGMTGQGGHLNVVKYLIDEKKADVHQKDNYGNTLLHAAGKNGALDVVKYLVEEKGLNVNAKNNDGSTPLTESINKGKVDVVKYLESKKNRHTRRRRDTEFVAPAHNSAYKHYSIINSVAGFVGRIPTALVSSSKNSDRVDSVFHLNAVNGLLIMLGIGIQRVVNFGGRGSTHFSPGYDGLLTPSELIERRIDPNATFAVHDSLEFSDI